MKTIFVFKKYYVKSVMLKKQSYKIRLIQKCEVLLPYYKQLMYNIMSREKHIGWRHMSMSQVTNIEQHTWHTDLEWSLLVIYQDFLFK